MSTQRKVACITGASSGIGRQSAISLAATGLWSIVLSGRRTSELEKTAELCKEAYHGTGKEEGDGNEPLTLSVAGDVGVEENVKGLFEKIDEVYGRLDMLFNNAGISAPPTPIETLSLETFLSVMQINLVASVVCTKYAVGLMKREGEGGKSRGGRIINNGSISAYSPRPDSAAYTISKHAITGLTKSTSLDGRKYNIAASQIDIGNAMTAMGGQAAKGHPQPNGQIEVEPTFDVKEVGDAIVYMAGLPLGTNILNMTIMATAMPFVARG